MPDYKIYFALMMRYKHGIVIVGNICRYVYRVIDNG